MFYLTLGGKLYAAPILGEQRLNRVLDLGTGTGIWAMDFGTCRSARMTSKILNQFSGRAP